MSKFIALDLETTGVDFNKKIEIIELGVYGNLDERDGSFLFKPEVDITPMISSITHITNSMVSDKPKFSINALNVISPDDVLVIHNSRYDMEVLRHNGVTLSNKVIDTFRVCQVLYPGEESYSLQYMRYLLNLDLNIIPHRAYDDCIVLMEVFKVLLSKMSYEQMLEISINPLLLPTCPLTKHKGKPWSEVPVDYLKWIWNSFEPNLPNEDILFTVANEFTKRGVNF